jgi:hypothetical protein
MSVPKTTDRHWIDKPFMQAASNADERTAMNDLTPACAASRGGGAKAGWLLARGHAVAVQPAAAGGGVRPVGCIAAHEA